MKIIVGSKNPVKIGAVKSASSKTWKDKKIDIIGIEASSKVSEQPRTNEEAIKGALNRAKESISKNKSNLGIGIESCVYENNFGMFVTAWAVAINKKGDIGIGGGGSLLLPDKISKEIKKGKELGPVMDGFTGENDTKKKQGTVGILTNNLIKREESLEKAVIFALSKFNGLKYFN